MAPPGARVLLLLIAGHGALAARKFDPPAGSVETKRRIVVHNMRAEAEQRTIGSRSKSGTEKPLSEREIRESAMRLRQRNEETKMERKKAEALKASSRAKEMQEEARSAKAKIQQQEESLANDLVHVRQELDQEEAAAAKADSEVAVLQRELEKTDKEVEESRSSYELEAEKAEQSRESLEAEQEKTQKLATQRELSTQRANTALQGMLESRQEAREVEARARSRLVHGACLGVLLLVLIGSTIACGQLQVRRRRAAEQYALLHKRECAGLLNTSKKSIHEYDEAIRAAEERAQAAEAMSAAVQRKASLKAQSAQELLAQAESYVEETQRKDAEVARQLEATLQSTREAGL